MMNNTTTYWIPGMGAVTTEPYGRHLLRYEEASPRVVVDLEVGDVVDLMDEYGNVMFVVQVLPGRIMQVTA